MAPLAGQPVEVVLWAAVSAGFDGLYADRLGYADRGADLEADVSSLLGGARPLVSRNRRLVFFDLRSYGRR